jgi:hypothetical protein
LVDIFVFPFVEDKLLSLLVMLFVKGKSVSRVKFVEDIILLFDGVLSAGVVAVFWLSLIVLMLIGVVFGVQLL